MKFFSNIFKKPKKQSFNNKAKKRSTYITTVTVIAIICGILAGIFLNKPSCGQFLDSDMDISGNVFMLGVDESSGKYKLLKISAKTKSVSKQVNLERGNGTTQIEYSNLEVDSEGNVYIVKRVRNLDSITSNKFLYPILYESVLMYSNNTGFVKEVAKIDFSNTPVQPTYPYIKKLQSIQKKLMIIGAKSMTYDIFIATPLEDEEPKKIKSFDIVPPVESSSDTAFDYVTDVATISNGRIFYSTKKGELFATDNQDNFLDYSNILGKSEISIVGFSSDSSDNLYFTDALTGTFYKLNTRSITATPVCKLEETKGANVKISDLRTIKAIGENDFFAPSKSFESQFFARFGNENTVIKNVRNSFFPRGILITIAVGALVFAIGYAIDFIFRYEIKRIPIAVKITSLFLPFYFVSMGILAYVTYFDSSSDYVSVLREFQDTGAKIVASGIDGNTFSEVKSVNDFLSSKYIKLQTSVAESFSSAQKKIGDKTDYVVTYLVKNDKIYSNFSEKFSSDSNSFNELKYVDPDMVTKGVTLVDTVLEEDEKAAIYDVWKNMKDGKSSIDRREFRDIRGKISASFAPIKNNSGAVIGFAGNFLDEKIHKNRKLNKILTHSISLSLIFAVVVAAYMIFITKKSLKPLKKLEQGINSIEKGDWSVNIKLASKDEFADIVKAFNLMSDKISQYTKNLTILNREYSRYTPKSMIKLLGKNKITDVNLFDFNSKPLNMVYLAFNISCRENYDFDGEKSLLDVLNSSYTKIFEFVNKNGGLIHSFDGTCAIFLFEDAQDAMNTSLQLKEIFIDEKLKNNMHILLGFDDVLVGVSGNEERRNIIIVSDELIQLSNINSYMKAIQTNHIATESFMSKIDTSLLNYRFIGQTSNISNENNIKLYEFIDTTNLHKSNLYATTKSNFENGVRAYINSNFEEARKFFTDVLSINNNDRVSLHYLMLCDDEINGKNAEKQFTGNIF